MNLKSFAVLALLLVAATHAAHAIEPNPPGKLAIHVAISDDPGFAKKWIASAPSNGFVISRMSDVRAGQTAYIGFLVTGHTAGADGLPDVTIDASIYGPDGSQLFDMSRCCAVRYRTGTGGFVMADPAVDLRFDNTDPPGTWTVRATASDNLAGTTAQGSATLELRR